MDSHWDKETGKYKLFLEGFCTKEAFNNLDQDGRDMMFAGFQKDMNFTKLDGEFCHAFLDYAARHVTISSADDLRAMPEQATRLEKWWWEDYDLHKVGYSWEQCLEGRAIGYPVYTQVQQHYDSDLQKIRSGDSWKEIERARNCEWELKEEDFKTYLKNEGSIFTIDGALVEGGIEPVQEAFDNQDRSFPVYVKATDYVKGLEKRMTPQYLRVIRTTKGWVCKRDGNELELMFAGEDDDAPIGTMRVLTRDNDE